MNNLIRGIPFSQGDMNTYCWGRRTKGNLACYFYSLLAGFRKGPSAVSYIDGMMMMMMIIIIIMMMMMMMMMIMIMMTKMMMMIIMIISVLVFIGDIISSVFT